LYANVLNFQNITDSSFYYITKAQNDSTKLNVTDSLFYTYCVITEFYRYFGEKTRHLLNMNQTLKILWLREVEAFLLYLMLINLYSVLFPITRKKKLKA
jgi:hypothetical protein